MFGEKVQSGLYHYARVAEDGLSVAGFKQFEPGGSLASLARGPPSVALRVALPIGILPVSSGEGCCLFGLGDCLGIGVGGAAVGGCSSIGGVFVAEWAEAMEGFPPIECDMRWPELL